MCFGSPKISVPAPPPPPAVPPPTEQELNLQRQQAALLEENLGIIRQQRAEDVAGRAAFEKATGIPMGEFVAKQAKGTIEITDLIRDAHRRQLAREQQADEQLQAQRAEFMRVVGLSPEAAEAEEAGRQLKLSRALGERFEKATKGELPVSPGLERALTTEEQQLGEQMLRDLGPGWETGTPGIEAVRRFRQSAEELRENARRGAINEAEQFGFALNPALLRVTAARNARGGVDTMGRSTAAGLAIPQMFRGNVYDSPPQIGDIYRQLFADRALQFNANTTGYQGQLQHNQLLTNARTSRAGYQAATNQALINGMFGLAGAGVSAI